MGKGAWRASGALLLLIVITLAGNLSWLVHNVVLIGRDASGHLERTAKIAEVLSRLTPQSLFTALTYHDYRPPALYLAAQPFYQGFGQTMDAAQLVNVAFMVAILLLTYRLARKVVTPPLALLAVALTAFWPMLMAMSRLFYMENLLTTMLLLNLLALLNCAGFTRRGWSLLWGASLGLALLVKWTAPIYLLLPTLWVLWRQFQVKDGVAATLRHTVIAARNVYELAWVRLLGVTVGALLLTLLWYWPNRAAMAEFLLGDWIAVGWVLVLALLGYTYLQKPTPMANFLTALWLGLALASLWYFPRIDFLNRLNDVAFGTDRGNQAAYDPLRLSNYTRYFTFLIEQHLGWLAALLILPAGLLPWLGRLRQWRMARPQVVLLWSSLLSMYLFLSFLAQATERNLVPILPLLAILFADALRAYPPRLAVGIGVLWVVVLASQWMLFTFDRFTPFYQQSAALWASSEYLVQPASGVTDPAYWIAPDVLATIAQAGTPEGKPATLGMLIDSWEIHRGAFRYLIAEQQLPIDLNALTEADSRGWSDLVTNQWILLKDGDNGAVATPGQALLQRLQAGDPLFPLLYQPVKRYPLPHHEEAILYHRTVGPARPQDFPVLLIETSQIADAINQWWSKGATLFFSNLDVATWVGIHDLVADRVLVPQSAADSAESLLADAHGLIFAVTRYDTGPVQDYLRATSDFVREVGDGEFRLAIFGRNDQPLTPAPVTGAWADLQITALQTVTPLPRGHLLPVAISATGMVDGSRQISLRLVDPAGTVVAQADTTLLPQLRVVLLAPPTTALGPYTLAAVVYDPATLAPFPGANGQEMVELARIAVEDRP